MVDMSGIPKAPTPAQLYQELRDLKRTVERLTSAPTYVSVGNIVEGGTISEEAGEQLTVTVQEKIVVGRENVNDDALNGRALVGSSVTALGEYMAGDPANPSNPYNPYRKVRTRAILDSRPDPDALDSSTRWAGMYLESEDPALPDPLFWARLVGSGDGATLYSKQQVKDGPMGDVTVGAARSGLRVTGEPHPTNRLPGTHSEVQVGANTFRMQSSGQPDIVGKNTAGVAHTGDGILRLEGANGVLVNGAPIGGGGAKVPSTQLNLIGGFTHFVLAGWTGVRYSRSGDIVQVSGAYTRGSYGSQEVVCVLPKDVWPSAKVKGTNVEVDAAGQVLTVISGSGPQSFGITYLL